MCLVASKRISIGTACPKERRLAKIELSLQISAKAVNTYDSRRAPAHYLLQGYDSACLQASESHRLAGDSAYT